MADSVIVETLYFIASYIGIILFFFFGINWLSKGWLKTFIKVRASKGKKTMVIVHGIADTYYRIGQFVGNAFQYKDRDGKGRTITSVSRKDIIHSMGVTALEVDGPTGTIVQRGETKEGCNPEDTDNYIKRVIEAPMLDDKWKKAVIILLVLVFVMVIIGLFMIYNNAEAIKTLTASGVIQ